MQGKAKGERHLVEEPQQWIKSAYTLHLELSPKSIEFENSARRQIFCPNPFQAENPIQAENIARAKVQVYIWQFYSDILFDGIHFDILSDILSDIYSGILSGIYSGILSGIYLYRHSFWHSGIHPDILSAYILAVWHSLWHSFWHSTWQLFWQSCWQSNWYYKLSLASGWVPQMPKRSGACGWGRSASAHWDSERAVEVRQCPMRSGRRKEGGMTKSRVSPNLESHLAGREKKHKMKCAPDFLYWSSAQLTPWGRCLFVNKPVKYHGWKKSCTSWQVAYPIIEGSLEVKLPTIWTDEKQSRAEAERRED